MACNQTLAGIPFSCDTSLGGIKRVFLANQDDVTATIDATTHTATLKVAAGKKFATYVLQKQTGGLESTINVGDNGTRYYTNTITMQFLKMEAAKHLEIETVAAGQLCGIVEDNNGKYWFVGYDGYLSVSEATASAGTAYSDLNGYTTTLTADSNYLPFEIAAEDIPALISDAV